jgi:hypothetical protein
MMFPLIGPPCVLIITQFGNYFDDGPSGLAPHLSRPIPTKIKGGHGQS